MFRARSQGQLDSFLRVWIRSFSLMLVLIFGLFILFATAIIFTRSDRNIASLLERNQAIAWTEYSQFFEESTSTLTLLSEELESGILLDMDALSQMLAGRPAFDLWFVTDQQGRVLLSSGNSGSSALGQLSTVAQPAWHGGSDVASSELVALETLQSFDPVLAQRAIITGEDAQDQLYNAVFQVAAVPYRDKDHRVVGALVVAHLLNNDVSIAERVREKIPNSFTTVSDNGIRVAGNLSTPDIPSFIGTRQAADLRVRVLQGERYYGRVILTSDMDHLVVSDPIHDSQGQVIGAVTTGHPSQGLASLKQDTALYIALSALLCWGCVLVGSVLVSKQWSVPIGNLAKVAKRIYEAEEIKPDHIALVNAVPSARTSEIEDLQLCFTRMTTSLYEKNQEILGYLEELKTERNHLKSLANQLQEANATLEARVEEKTLKLRDAMLDLVEASNLKSKLLANTSHELRTPLNSIIGFSDMLTGGIYGELTEAQRNRVTIIGDSARYLLNLINDLLDVSLVAQGKMILDRQLVDLNELVTSALTIIRNDCEQNRIQILVEPGANLPQVFVDPNRIKQVVYNVLSNAVKYTPEGGTIRVQTSAAGGEVILTVQDSGIGISENDQLYVFDEFYQGENTGHRKAGGFGLGLPLSRRLVELHGGRIELKSALGEGTTVTVHLPINHTSGEDTPPVG